MNAKEYIKWGVIIVLLLFVVHQIYLHTQNEAPVGYSG